MSSAGTVEERDILDRRYCAARLVKNNDAKLLSFGVKGVSTGEWPWIGSGAGAKLFFRSGLSLM